MWSSRDFQRQHLRSFTYWSRRWLGLQIGDLFLGLVFQCYWLPIFFSLCLSQGVCLTVSFGAASPSREGTEISGGVSCNCMRWLVFHPVLFFGGGYISVFFCSPSLSLFVSSHHFFSLSLSSSYLFFPPSITKYSPMLNSMNFIITSSRSISKLPSGHNTHTHSR